MPYTSENLTTTITIQNGKGATGAEITFRFDNADRQAEFETKFKAAENFLEAGHESRLTELASEEIKQRNSGKILSVFTAAKKRSTLINKLLQENLGAFFAELPVAGADNELSGLNDVGSRADSAILDSAVNTSRTSARQGGRGERRDLRIGELDLK